MYYLPKPHKIALTGPLPAPRASQGLSGASRPSQGLLGPPRASPGPLGGFQKAARNPCALETPGPILVVLSVSQTNSRARPFNSGQLPDQIPIFQTNCEVFWAAPGPILGIPRTTSGCSRTNSGHFPANSRSFAGHLSAGPTALPRPTRSQPGISRTNSIILGPPKPSQHLPDTEKSRAQTNAERVPNQFWGLPDHVWASPGQLLDQFWASPRPSLAFWRSFRITDQ